MRKHLIAAIRSAGAAPVLCLALGAAASAFVISADNGAWGKVEEVPGTSALNTGGAAEVRSVSCGSAGNCSAGGNVQSPAGSQAWVASENNGTWGRAREVAAALNTGGNAAIASVSCPAAATCGAGGSYANRSGHLQAFVIYEANGAWGRARQVAGPLNTGGNAQIYTLSCASAGNCGAGGYYRDSSRHYQAFVVTEHNGIWGAAAQVAAALNTGGDAAIESVSCPSAGNCSADGFYADGHLHLQAFVVDEKHGTWGNAKEVPSTAALNQGGNAVLESLSCASASHCSAGGYYFLANSIQQAFVVSKS